MANIDKVLVGLKQCVRKGDYACRECAYWTECGTGDGICKLFGEAAEVIEEQKKLIDDLFSGIRALRDTIEGMGKGCG